MTPRDCFASDQAELTAAVGMGTGHKKKLGKMLIAPAATEPASLAPKEEKFYAKQLVMGQATEAAHGLNAALGLSDTELGQQLQLGEKAIVHEFMNHGNDEDKANLQYVLNGTALKEEDMPAHIHQQIREHKHHGYC